VFYSRNFGFYAILDIPTKIIQPVANNEPYEESDVLYKVDVDIDLVNKIFRVLFITPFDIRPDRWAAVKGAKEIAFHGDPETTNKYVWERIRSKLDAIVKYLYAEMEEVLFELAL